MADMAPKSPSRFDDLNPQDIFEEINSELVSGKRGEAPRQKTLPNYAYVILLNLVLLSTVSLGIFVVYRIFREQGIKLTAGAGGIQSLELLLTEQEDRRKAEELRKKEAQLQAAQRATDQIAGELETVRSDIRNQVTVELARQKAVLASDIQRQLQGKSQAEQRAIQERYNQEIVRLQAEAQADMERRLSEAETQRRELLQQQQAEQEKTRRELDLLLEQNRQRERAGAIAAPPAPVIQTVYDNGAASLFNAIERQLRAHNYTEVERQLKNIERIYERPAPPEKRSADLFLVSLIRDYISVSNNNSNLVAQIINLSNDLAGAAGSKPGTPAESGYDTDMERFRVLVEEISLLVDRDPEDPGLSEKIRTLQKRVPDAFVFYNSYRRYRMNDESRKASPLIRKGQNAFAQRNFAGAVSSYQTVLKDYPGIPEQPSVLSNLYQAIYAQASEGKGVPYSAKAGLVYMKAPDGYIFDMASDRIIISLMPGVALKPGKKINIFKVNTANGLELLLLDSAVVDQMRGSYAAAPFKGPSVKVGDLVYLAK